MSQKKNKKPPADTLGEFFTSIIEQAKLNAAAGSEAASMLLALMAELGQFTAELARQVDATLAGIDKEMKGKSPAAATPLAYRLRGKAEAYGHVAQLVSAMVKRLEVRDEETVH